MDKLTNLIQEAKPLYKKKKRQKAIMKTCFIFTIPAIMGASLIGLYNTGEDIYVSLENNSLQQELIEDDMELLR